MKFLSVPPAFRVAGKPVVKRVVFGVLALIAAFLGAMTGLLMVYSTDLPQISDLERYRPSTITELYDDHGRQIGSFALQRRVLASYDDFPKVLRDAILSTEDKNFEKHLGINFWRVLGATYRDIVSGSRAQGASTLTMQLSRNLFLSPERTFRRKIQEALIAVWLEGQLSKQDILLRYLNTAYFGAGAYGVDSAARRYFGKKARELRG